MEKDNFLDKIKVEGIEPKKALLRAQIVAFLTGERMLKEILEENKKNNNGLPITGKTFNNKIKEFITGEDKEIEELYHQYKGQKNRGVDYTEYIIRMLLEDKSQREIAEKYNINRNSFKDAIRKTSDPILKRIIREHAEVHAKGRNCQAFVLDDEEEVYLRDYLKKLGMQKNNGNETKDDTDKEERKEC